MRIKAFLFLCPIALLALWLLRASSADPAKAERLAHHRNLGKAFFENPATQNEAVEQFRQALALNPASAVDRLNHGLALLNAGRAKEGIAELEKVQRQDPKIPHTWFNLGIQFKKAGDYGRATRQLDQMARLVPDEAITHYNLGTLYKIAGQTERATGEFETAARLDPNFAAPHFQLYSLYRQAGRRAEAAERFERFQQIKTQQENAPIPEDVEWSFYSEVYDESTAPAEVLAPPAEWKFSPRRLAGAVGDGPNLAVADIDTDARPDLLVWSSAGLRVYRSAIELLTDDTLADLRAVLHVAPADFDNDGATDLAVLTGVGPVLLASRKGRFERRPMPAAASSLRFALWLDYDRDYDLDLFLLGDRSMLLRNEGAAGFSDRSADFPFENAPALAGIAFRVVPDSKAIDLAVSYRNRAGVLYRDRLGGRYEAMPLPGLPAGARSLNAADVDNNGRIDLAFVAGGGVRLLLNRSANFALVDTPAAGPFVLADLDNRAALDLIAAAIHRNHGQGKFAEAAAGPPLPAAEAWAAADFDADGKIDLAAADNEGAVHVLVNQSPAAHRWLRVALAGTKNQKLALGAEVEVKAGRRYQKMIYAGVPLLFGMAAAAEADTVRITWPNGLIQNEARQAAGRAHSYTEAQRLSGSCPMIWAWNGSEFEFITDVLGVAPLGAAAADGQYFPVDHDEWVSIRGASLAARDGHYELRVTEELSEVTYLDHLRLVAVDHPADVRLLTNEKFQGPPFPSFRLFGVRRRVYPIAARDHQGRDVRSRLLAVDSRYPDQFARSRLGVAEPHFLEIDFGSDAARSNRALLVLTGWVDWADGSTFRAASQDRTGGLVMPYLQVKDTAGHWRTVLDNMGMPAGKPKSIVVDLSGKFLSASRQVRIVTNLCVYWDEIFLTEDTGEPPARLRPLPLADTDLHFRGFSRVRIHPQRKQPERFFYTAPLPVSMWNPTPGLYTRYGAVSELIESVDDRFVIMGSGDELRLMFPADLPTPAPGWKRDFLLLVDGWAKDSDPNTAHARSVEPLPFHAMSRYPYPPQERFPDAPLHISWKKQYNNRQATQVQRSLRTGE